MPRSKVKIMISSRCNDSFPGTTTSLSDIRKRLKEEIEKEKLFDEQIFKVWINEDAPPEPGNATSWEHCLKQVRDADLLLVLYNGNAGWTRSGGDIGICHDEFASAYSESPGKVCMVSFIDKENKPKEEPDKRFQDYVERASLFRGGDITCPDDLIREAKKAVHKAFLTLAIHGAREVKRSRYDAGWALDWSRMNFKDRQEKMHDTLIDALVKREGSERIPEDAKDVVIKIEKAKILFLPSAIPAAMTIPAAREMVGQPFLQDYRHASRLTKSIVGPVHVIACHKSITENQAMKLLGFPDATIIISSFGIYVADNIQKIQLCLIANCRDDSSTRHGLQKFFEWLSRTSEEKFLIERATARSKILQTIAEMPP